MASMELSPSDRAVVLIADVRGASPLWVVSLLAGSPLLHKGAG